MLSPKLTWYIEKHWPEGSAPMYRANSMHCVLTYTQIEQGQFGVVLDAAVAAILPLPKGETIVTIDVRGLTQTYGDPNGVDTVTYCFREELSNMLAKVKIS